MVLSHHSSFGEGFNPNFWQCLKFEYEEICKIWMGILQKDFTFYVQFIKEVLFVLMT